MREPFFEELMRLECLLKVEVLQVLQGDLAEALIWVLLSALQKQVICHAIEINLIYGAGL